ncbi:hypothetical protein WA158_005634 [Blastocystis sp. Blastoise]
MSTHYKIDAHQHFWIYSPIKHNWMSDEMTILKKDYLPPQLAPFLKENGFYGTVAVQAQLSTEENDFLVGLAEKYPEVVRAVVGWVDLTKPDVEKELAKLAKNPKLVGIRHIVQDEPDVNYLLREDFCRGVALLKKYNLTYDILIFPKHLQVAAEFVEKFPDQPFVIDHIAKPFIKDGLIDDWEQGMRKLASFPNVMVKVSGMVTEDDWKNWKKEDFKKYLDIIFDAFGTDRIMIGSDWPVCTLAGNYGTVVSIVEEYIKKYPLEEQQKVLGDNAVKFYHIPL